MYHSMRFMSLFPLSVRHVSLSLALAAVIHSESCQSYSANGMTSIPLAIFGRDSVDYWFLSSSGNLKLIHYTTAEILSK
jgi:hypothetical protein